MSLNTLLPSLEKEDSEWEIVLMLLHNMQM